MQGCNIASSLVCEIHSLILREKQAEGVPERGDVPAMGRIFVPKG